MASQHVLINKNGTATPGSPDAQNPYENQEIKGSQLVSEKFSNLILRIEFINPYETQEEKKW